MPFDKKGRTRHTMKKEKSVLMGGGISFSLSFEQLKLIYYCSNLLKSFSKLGLYIVTVVHE